MVAPLQEAQLVSCMKFANFCVALLSEGEQGAQPPAPI